MEESSNSDILSRFRITRIIWPVLIGIVATVGYIFYKDVIAGDGEIRKAISAVQWTGNSFLWVFAGFLMMFIRDIGYIWRMWILTDKKLSLRAAFEVTLLWEFFSAMSPSVVGGSAFAIYMLIKEKISAGRSTAIIFIAIFLDEVFYLLVLPPILFLLGPNQIFDPIRDLGAASGNSLVFGFWIAYTVIFLYTSFLAFALFIRPEGTHKVIRRLSMARIFKRWQRNILRLAEELLVSSYEFRSKRWTYWLWAWVATLMAWLGRYLVLNCVIAAFAIKGLGLMDHILAFARQAVMFVFMLVSPTPGSSGVAELMFINMLEDLTPPDLGIALAALWRLITYYPYLFIGFILLPRWTRRVFKEKKPVVEPEKV
ncbi:MAG: lysylphosphatidylglycerol synthase transmembrane domain-containing protein [Bacteroidota bacterium]